MLDKSDYLYLSHCDSADGAIVCLYKLELNTDFCSIADLLVGTFTLLTRLSNIQGASSTGADKAVRCQKCGSLLGSLNSSWDTSFNQAETGTYYD